MGEHRDAYRTLGYATLLSAIIIGVINIIMASNMAKGFEKEILKYGIYGIISSVPLVIVAGACWKSIPRKSNMSAAPNGKSKHALKIEMNEFILADTRPHPLHFFKMSTALLAMTLLFFALSFLYGSYPAVKENYWWWGFLIFSGIFATISYIPGANVFRRSPYMYHTARIWAIIFALWWGITAAAVLKAQVERAYPRVFWEQFLGLPSIAMIMFAIILFLFSGMLWRIDAYISEKGPGPIGTVSTTLMAAGIASLFPPLWALFSESAIHLFFVILLSSTVIYWTMLFLFVYYRGGMKFVFTNRRIISIKDFFGMDVQEHPYDSIISTEIIQGILGRHFDYGDLKFTVKRGKIKVGFTVHGIRNPLLIKNTVMALSSREKMRVKKRPAEENPLPHVEPMRYYGPSPKKTYHLRPY